MKLICFGAFSAWEGSHELEFRSDKIRALLAYLALNANQLHRRDSLAAMFWGDLPDDKAKTNLRLSLSRLGQSLAAVTGYDTSRPLLETDRQTVQLNLMDEDHWIDVRIFEMHLAACRATPLSEWWRDAHCVAHLQTAVELYTAPFLAGLHIEGAGEFEAWRLWRAETYHQQALTALQALTTHQLALHQFQAAQLYARQQLRLEPWRETAHQQLMQALAASGQTDAALNQYERCRRILAEEFASTPDDHTQSLAADIRRGQIHTSALFIGRMSAPTTRFFGRQSLLNHIGRLLLDSHSRLITLTGMGGIGKTRLAIEAARRFHHLFRDSIWFVPLADTAVDPPKTGPMAMETALIEAMTRVLNLQPHERVPLKQQLWQALKGRSLLLVLDNFEHMVSGIEFIAEMLAQLPQVKLLVTSRTRLQLQAETVIPLAGLSLPERGSPTVALPQQLRQYAAVDLFAERARRIDYSFALTSQSGLEVAAICDYLEGNPLGIELAAAWVSSLSLTQIATAIQADIDLLATNMIDVPLRQRSMRAAFAGSWRLLLPEEQRLLAGLSVFRGDFDLTAVTSILAADKEDLARLVQYSLLAHQADGRYRMHTLLHQFAAEKRNALPLNEAEIEHVAYYLDYVCSWEATLNGDDLELGLQAIERELDNVQQACRRAISTGQFERLTKALYTLHWFFRFRGLAEPGQVLFTEMIVQLKMKMPEGKPQNQAQARLLGELLLVQARLMWFTDKPAKIQEVSQQLLALAQTQVLDELIAPAHLLLAGAYVLDGRYRECQEHANIGYIQAKERQQEMWQMEAASRLAYLAMLNGKLDEARTYATEALKISQKKQMRESEITARTMLANFAFQVRQMETAKTEFEEAQILNKRRGNPLYWASEINDRLAKVMGDLGHYDRALSLIRQAIDGFQELGVDIRANSSQTALGAIYLRLGHYDEAEAIFKKLLTLSGRANSMSVFVSLMNLSILCRQQARSEQAVKHARAALKLVEASGSTRYLAEAHQTLGEALLAEGELTEARMNLEQALAFYENGRLPKAVSVQASLAWLTLAQGNQSDAVQQVESTLRLIAAQSLDGIEDCLQIYWICFQVLNQVNDERAADLLQIAYDRLQTLAGRIQDTVLRQAYLDKVVVHQQIQARHMPVRVY